MLAHYGLKRSTFQHHFNFSAPEGKTVWDVFKDVTHEFTDLVEDLAVRQTDNGKGEMKFFDLDNQSQDGFILGN